MQILQNLWMILRKMGKYGLLIEIILLASIFWLMERMIGEIARHPRAITGTNPIGAASVVKWGLRAEVWLLSQGRTRLGHFVQNHYHQVYQRVHRLFRRRKEGSK